MSARFVSHKRWRIGQNPQSGFTLIEVMVVIAIVGIFITIAAPSFTSFINTMRIKSASFDLVNDLNLARSEAIKRNADVVVVRLDAGGWQGGWRIDFDPPTAAAITLRQREAVGGAVTIAPNPDTITFQGNGRPTATVNFSLTSTLTGVTPRCVRLTASGAARSELNACS